MGRIYKPRYSMTLASGQRVTRTVKWWHIEYADAAGRTRRRKVAPSKVLAREILARAEAEVAKQRAGLPAQDAAEMILSDLKDRYLTSQQGRVSPDHLSGLKSRIEAVLAGTRALKVRDLTPERMEGFLNAFADRKRAPSARTVNTYLIAAKAMMNWAVLMRLLPYNPLACLKARSERVKKRRRRALTADEVERLLAAAPLAPLRRLEAAYRGGRKSKKRQGEIGPEVRAEASERGRRNALIWRILVSTGLRVGELRALRWADVDLASGSLTARAETTKNGRESVLPMSPSLVAALTEHGRQCGANPEDPVIDIPENPCAILRDDLRQAGIDPVDASGRVVDVHALRHTFGTLLVASGADLKTVQSLMRHASPVLTFGFYVHHDAQRMRDAVGRLPGPPVAGAASVPVSAAS